MSTQSLHCMSSARHEPQHTREGDGTGHALQLPSSLFLIDCIHPSCYVAAEAEKVMRALEVLHRILHNLQQHPAEPRFHRISTRSAAWQRGIVPACYVLRVAEWLGLAAQSTVTGSDDDDVHLRFVSRDAPLPAAACDAALGPASVRFVSARLVELRALRAAWLPSHVTSDAVPSAAGSDARRAALRAWLAAAFASFAHDRNDARWSALKRWLRLRLVWLRLCEGGSRDEAAHVERVLADEAGLFASLPHASLRDLALVELEDCLRAAELVSMVSARVLRDNDNDNNSSSRHASREATRAVSEEVRRRIAARHRAELAAASVQAQCAESSAAYRALSAEEKLVGTALIADIAAFMEQVATVRGEQGMVRQDRLAARELLRRFKRDADLGALHALRDVWEDRLEAAKREVGKALVYYTDAS